MVDNVAPKQTLGKRPSMEDVMLALRPVMARVVYCLSTARTGPSV